MAERVRDVTAEVGEFFIDKSSPAKVVVPGLRVAMPSSCHADGPRSVDYLARDARWDWDGIYGRVSTSEGGLPQVTRETLSRFTFEMDDLEPVPPSDEEAALAERLRSGPDIFMAPVRQLIGDYNRLVVSPEQPLRTPISISHPRGAYGRAYEALHRTPVDRITVVGRMAGIVVQTSLGNSVELGPVDLSTIRFQVEPHEQDEEWLISTIAEFARRKGDDETQQEIAQLAQKFNELRDADKPEPLGFRPQDFKFSPCIIMARYDEDGGLGEACLESFFSSYRYDFLEMRNPECEPYNADKIVLSEDGEPFIVDCKAGVAMYLCQAEVSKVQS